MNRHGFTLIELLATLVLLGIIMGIAVISVTGAFGNTKNKTEEIFISTIEDALDIYLDSDAKKLTYNASPYCTVSKTHGMVNIYKANNISFSDVINSSYSPISQSDLVNPADKDTACADGGGINVSIYRDDDFVYYYKVDKGSFNCLKTDGYITNLPEECL